MLATLAPVCIGIVAVQAAVIFAAGCVKTYEYLREVYLNYMFFRKMDRMMKTEGRGKVDHWQ